MTGKMALMRVSLFQDGERDLKETAVDVTDLIELKQRQTKLSLQYEFS